MARIADARQLGHVLTDSQSLAHPAFPDAHVRSPLMLKLDVRTDTAKFTQEWFGPISFVIATDSSAQSLDLAGSIAAEHGALTFSVYRTDDAVVDAAYVAAIRGGVALSINLTGGVFVNQTAAYSDFHGTGANPAANSALSDAAYVANPFPVVQSTLHSAPSTPPPTAAQTPHTPAPQP